MPPPAFSLLKPGVKEAIWRLGWKTLRPIQTQAIEVVLGSEDDLIISAPTAGGKTEAAFLPILSKLSEAPGMVVIYVSPLKALINDQWSRLDRLCSEMEIPVRRWHGDVPASEKKQFREHPRGILLITPESLESNFVNYGRMLPRVYANTGFVVIDELHAFVDGVRGMHLRSLMARLCTAAGCHPRFVGLSATLGNPEAAQEFLRPEQPKQVRLITEPSGGQELRLGLRAYMERPRHDDQRLVPRRSAEEAARVSEMIAGGSWRSETPLAALGVGLGLPPPPQEIPPRDALDEIADDVAAHFQEGTNLVFGNSRSTLEELADTLHERAVAEKWPYDPFCVHHGSLAKVVREEVEERLKGGSPTTALCTSTLELGIDIGDVRTVGQVDPPWSVASLVQRLGRSGRRPGEPARMRIYARDETPHADSTLTALLYPRLLRSVAMVQLMLAKWREEGTTARLHLSTLVHQILSVLRQTGGEPAPALFEQLCVTGPFRAVDKDMFIRILRSLGESEIVEQMPQGEIILAPEGEAITSHYDFYAAFASNEMLAVRHGEEQVGEMPGDVVPPEGQCFILNGRRWEVETVEAPAKIVWVKPTQQRVPPLFGGDGGDIDKRIFSAVRELLAGDSIPPYLDQSARHLLNAARTAAQVSGVSGSGVVFTAKHALWYPWTGSRGMRTLRLMLKSLKVSLDYDSLALYLPRSTPEEFRALLIRLKQTTFDPVDLAAMMDVKEFDKFDELLGEDILNAMNGRDRIDLAEAMEAVEAQLAKTKLREAVDLHPDSK